MGNCCKPASSTEWDGEDWSDLTSKKTRSSKVFDEAHGHGHGLSLGKVQKEKLMEALRVVSPDANGKVRIKISRKEFAELLEKQQQVNKKQDLWFQSEIVVNISYSLTVKYQLGIPISKR